MLRIDFDTLLRFFQRYFTIENLYVSTEVNFSNQFIKCLSLTFLLLRLIRTHEIQIKLTKASSHTDRKQLTLNYRQRKTINCVYRMFVPYWSCIFHPANQNQWSKAKINCYKLKIDSEILLNLHPEQTFESIDNFNNEICKIYMI